MDHASRNLARLGIALAIAASVLLLYVLSFGPAVRLVYRGYISLETFSFLYTPLNWLAERSDVFSHLITWYGAFWVPDPYPS